MLRPLEMCRLNVVVLQHDMRAALEALGRMGGAQLVPLRENSGGDMLGEVDVTDRLSKAQALLERVKALQGELDCLIIYPARKTTPPSIDEVERLLPPLEERAGVMMKERTRLSEMLEGLAKQEEELENIKNLPLEAFMPDLLAFVVVRVGWVTDENLKTLEEEAKDFSAIVTVEKKGRKRLVVAIVPRKKRFVLQTLLEKLNFAVQKKPDGLKQSPLHALKNIRLAAEATGAELEMCENKLRRMGGDFGPQLALAREALDIEVSLLRAMSRFGRTRFCCIASGWVPTQDLEDLQMRLEKATEGRAFVDAQPVGYGDGRSAKVPVVIRSNRFFKPFKLLVINFGLPLYGEIDPTSFLAVSFLVLFGIMFGDVGQGAVLLGIGLLLKFSAKKESVRDFGFIIAAAGVSSIFFGLMLYGSVFGREGLIRISPVLLEPLHPGEIGSLHLTRLLIAAVALGVMQLSTGILLNILNRFSAKDYFKGIVDKFGLVGLVLYWGAIGLGIYGKAPGWAIAVLIGLPLVLIVLAGPLRMILGGSRDSGEEEGGLFMSLMEGGVELIETVIAFLANTASFIRVAAFALAHAGLSLAMWTVADAMSGVAVMPIVVVILGNILIIALEGLVAGIQAIRLIYYEFFGKFFGGDGVPFKPFKFRTSINKR